MALVDFLDVAPLEPETHVATITGRDGAPQEVRIYPVDNTALAKLARVIPELRALFRSDIPAEHRMLLYYEFAPHIIAAGLGKLGDKEYVAAAERMEAPNRRALFNAIFNLSFSSKEDEKEGEDKRPLPDGETGEAANDNAPSPPQSNS